MIITISGVAGSGKSTVAEYLKDKLGLKHYSMGAVQRKYATDRGMTIEEFGRLEATDPSLDQKVDAYQRELSQKEDNFVIDSWLGFYFIPDSIKVFLNCDDDVAAKRIYTDTTTGARDASERKAKSFEEAKKIRKERMETNRERWIRFYGLKADFLDRSNYDIVLDTTTNTPEEIGDKIIKFIKNK